MAFQLASGFSHASGDTSPASAIGAVPGFFTLTVVAGGSSEAAVAGNETESVSNCGAPSLAGAPTARLTFTYGTTSSASRPVT